MILKFQQRLYDVITKKGSHDFDRFVSALRNDLQKDFIEFGEKTSAFWNEIMSGQFQFNRNEQYNDLLNNSGLAIRDGFRRFVDRMFGQKSAYLTLDVDQGEK